MGEDQKQERDLSRKGFVALGSLALGGAMTGFGLWGSKKKAAASEAKSSPIVQPAPGMSVSIAQVGTRNPRMRKPRALTVDAAGLMYIAGESGVNVFDAAGKLAREIKTGEPAHCVAVAQDGALYVGHKTRVAKFGAKGQAQGGWGKAGAGDGEFKFITALAVYRQFVYVADAGNRRVHRFAGDGDFVDDLRGFQIPSPYFDLLVDDRGVLHVANTGNHRIERYDQNGKRLGQWGQFGAAPEDFCGCCNPTNFVYLPDGRLVTTEKGIPRLKVYDASQKVVAMLDSAAFPKGVAGMDLAVDAKGRIALLDPIEARVRFYELKPAK